MPKIKTGEKISWKEFFKRWKGGIEGITPLQKIKTQILGTRISLIGIFLGLIISIIGWENLWWIAIILLGALINTSVGYLGLVQQRNNIIKHEANCEEMSLDDLINKKPIKNKGGKK